MPRRMRRLVGIGMKTGAQALRSQHHAARTPGEGGQHLIHPHKAVAVANQPRKRPQSRLSEPRQSPSTHATFAPSMVMFSAKRGCARFTGAAFLMCDCPGMLHANINIAIAARMM